MILRFWQVFIYMENILSFYLYKNNNFVLHLIKRTKS